MTKVSIYALTCPFTFCPKYVGQTSQELTIRLNGHMLEGKANSKRMWMQALSLVGAKPGIVLLEMSDEFLGNEIELAWINKFKSLGFELYNNAQ
jgi:hypothetical protein